MTKTKTKAVATTKRELAAGRKANRLGRELGQALRQLATTPDHPGEADLGVTGCAMWGLFEGLNLAHEEAGAFLALAEHMLVRHSGDEAIVSRARRAIREGEKTREVRS